MKPSRRHRKDLRHAGLRPIPLPNGTFHNSAGWLRPEATTAHKALRDDIPEFSQLASHLAGTGENRTLLLSQAIKHVWGRALDTEPQADKDCVGFAFAGCVDVLACCKAVDMPRFVTTFEKRASPESVYALSRFEYGAPPPASRGVSRVLGGSRP